MTDPALQQFRMGGFHNLETARPVGLHPTRMVGNARGEHPAALSEPFSDQRHTPQIEMFDDHEKHAPQSTADGGQIRTAIASSKFKIQEGQSKIEKPKIVCSQLKIPTFKMEDGQ
jgi:hypothetical protein